TSNDILLDVALLHLELLGSQSILEAQRHTETQIYQVAVNTSDFAIAGERRTSDANRAQAEWKLHRSAVIRAEESVAVAAARLANRLNLDPAVRLRTMGGPLVPINLIALDTPVSDLLQYALRRRPELAARAADIERAEFKHKEELARPMLPTIWLGYSGGVFGGGSNVVPPLMSHFGGRTDFDVRVYWTLMNLGAGNLTLQKRRQAEVAEAEARRARVVNQVREQISSARATALAARDEIEIARSELESAENGFREDLLRSRQNMGRPIEVLNSLNLLGAARVNLINALLRYDQAQFRLFVALGSPPPLLEPPQDLPPAPVTTPLRGPLPVQGHPLKLGFEWPGEPAAVLVGHALAARVGDPENWEVDDQVLTEGVEDQEIVVVDPLSIRCCDREVSTSVGRVGRASELVRLRASRQPRGLVVLDDEASRCGVAQDRDRFLKGRRPGDRRSRVMDLVLGRENQANSKRPLGSQRCHVMEQNFRVVEVDDPVVVEVRGGIVIALSDDSHVGGGEGL
ncbi:MAG TPA: TolC family protein, partial [Isosphaeraceae bacterium]|nr:TolC family protein [Isosphaeraceae bacterium]